MPREEDSPLNRRVNIRRGRGNGFGRGSSTRSESLRITEDDMQEEDDVDRSIDPLVIRDRILTNARNAPAPAEALPPPTPNHDDSGIPDPRARMHQVAQAGSSNYSKEYRLSLLHRMLMRKVPLDQIAVQLGVSVSTIEKDRVQLKERLRTIARDMDINELIGGQQELYDEISGMALRTASNNQMPTAMQLAAMRTALAANADRTRFLNTAGVFDVLRYRRAEDGSAVSDVALLMSRTSEMLDRLMSQPEPDPEPAQPRPRARRTRPAAGGFAPFSMEDGGAQSGDDEHVEL